MLLLENTHESGVKYKIKKKKPGTWFFYTGKFTPGLYKFTTDLQLL
jgi:hypothetical protein